MAVVRKELAGLIRINCFVVCDPVRDLKPVAYLFGKGGIDLNYSMRSFAASDQKFSNIMTYLLGSWNAIFWKELP